MQRLLAPTEAAEVLGVTPGTLKRLRLARLVPFVALSPRVIRFAAADLDAYLERQRCPAVWEKRQYRRTGGRAAA